MRPRLHLAKPTVVARFLNLIASICATAFLLLSSGSVHAAVPSGISQSALDQIAALLNEKASWTPIQAKMDSELIHAVKNQRGQPFATAAPNLRLDVETQPDGRVLVD